MFPFEHHYHPVSLQLKQNICEFSFWPVLNQSLKIFPLFFIWHFSQCFTILATLFFHAAYFAEAMHINTLCTREHISRVHRDHKRSTHSMTWLTNAQLSVAKKHNQCQQTKPCTLQAYIFLHYRAQKYSLYSRYTQKLKWQHFCAYSQNSLSKSSVLKQFKFTAHFCASCVISAQYVHSKRACFVRHKTY